MNAVVKSQEFLRIQALPRRTWEDSPDLPEVVQLLTNYLKTRKGKMTLWPEQAVALQECHDCDGLFAPIAVGRGKALVSLLAPVVMEEVERPVLFVPANLRDQTTRKVIPEMKKHWKLHPKLKVVGYSELSLAHRAHLLDELQPDLVVLDESHAVKNPRAARTRRLARYLAESGARVVALSGTMTRKSLRDYHQLALWALAEGTPLPESWQELQDWADALDVGVPAAERVRPGALKHFCQNGESIREGFGRRLYETPGVVATGENELGVSLRLLKWAPAVPSGVHDAMDATRKTWCTPGGEEFLEAVDLWRHMRSLSLGMYYKWDPPPPKEWVEARKAWKAYVRDILLRSRKLDSELQVWNACEANENLRPDHPLHAWKIEKDRFQVNSVPVWINEFAVTEAVVWLTEHKGICWTEHVAFGEAVAKLANVPYFGAGDRASRDILDHEGPMVASISAHSEGKNLQRYSKMLITSPPSSGKRWEQVLGRTHRAGQQADTVEVYVASFCAEHRAAFVKAMEEAKYIQDSFGSRQKLLYADIAF